MSWTTRRVCDVEVTHLFDLDRRHVQIRRREKKLDVLDPVLDVRASPVGHEEVLRVAVVTNEGPPPVHFDNRLEGDPRVAGLAVPAHGVQAV